MSGSLLASRSLLQSFAKSLGSKQISALLASADKETVNLFCEIAKNLFATENFPLSPATKAPLKKYRKHLLIIVNKKQSLKIRRKVLVKNPLIAKILARLALTCVSA